MIDFSGKTYANILSEQLSRVPDDLDKREGSIVQTALGPESWYLEGVYMDMHRLQDNVYAGTAGGGSLDRIAEAYGITRKPATYAHKQGVFNVQVPIGFRVSAIQKNTSYIGLLDIWEPWMDYIHMTWNAKGMERLEMDIQDSYSQLTMLKG